MASIPYEVVFFDLGNTLVVSGQGWLPDAQEAVAELHGLGVRLGIISNTGNLTRAQLLALLPPDFPVNLFEPNLIILSSEVQIEKPKVAIFDLAIQKSAVKPSSCLFCTETLLDTLAAQTAGMHAARFQPPPNSDIGDLGTMIKDLGDLLN